VQATHDASHVPLLIGHVLHRRVRAFETAMKRNKQVNAADQDYPEQEERQGSKVVQGVPLGTE
jgi:hypothetical protein